MPHAPSPTAYDTADLEARVAAFEAAWRAGARPEVGRFLPTAGAHRKAVLVELIFTDLEFRARSGQPTGPDEYLLAFPELADDPAALAGLRAAERSAVRARGETGPAPEPDPRSRGLGRYTLGPVIGRGAFATVFRGWDPDLRRAVAVKVPRLGPLLSDEQSERFLREARCAAGLHHPNVVTLYDVGRSDDTVYLVAELVDGESLADCLARTRPAPADAARLVRTLAEAVEYAHGQGVVHRDLKPGNILLASGGRKPPVETEETGGLRPPLAESVPKIADFGLAKRLGVKATLTAEGQVLGTPAYMSREQACGEPADARSDVYSLGVILYELLAGRVPFRGDPATVLRAVIESEPAPPRRLNPAVSRDLQTICLTAMAKDPARRYPTAGSLAGDLARFLDGRPIAARPVGPLTRLLRWANREPRLAAALGGVVLALSAGLAAATGLYLDVRAQHRLAEARRQEADDNFRDALTVVEDYFTKVSETRLLIQPGMQPLRKELIESGLARYQQFLEKRGDDPALRAEVGRGWYRVGSMRQLLGSEHDAGHAFARAETVQRALIRDRADQPEHRADLARTLIFQSNMNHRFGDAEAALRCSTEAIELLRPVVAENGDRADWRRWLSAAYRNEARVHADFGDEVDSLAWYEAAARETGPLSEPDDRRSLAITRHIYALAFRGLGRMREALEQEREAARLDPDAGASDPSALQRRGNWLNGQGLMWAGLGRTEQAEKAFRTALAIRKQAADQNPSVPMYRVEYATTLHNLGTVLEAAGRLDAAADARGEAVKLYRAAARDNPEVIETTNTYPGLATGAARTLHRAGRPAAALATLEALDADCRRLEAERPLAGGTVASWAEGCRLAAEWLRNAGRAADADSRAADAEMLLARVRSEAAADLPALRSKAAAAPADGRVRRDLSRALALAARVERMSGRPAAAVPLTRERLALWARNPRERVTAGADLVAAAGALPSADREGLIAEAVGILAGAITDGFADVQMLNRSQEWDAARGDPGFCRLVGELAAGINTIPD
jgi:serine/threonine-protein kinase